jgi:hypothetical protein
MKVKLLVPEWGHKVGDIVEAKYFKDMTAEEIIEVNSGEKSVFKWDRYDLFIKNISDIQDSPWGFMWGGEVEVIE